MMKIPLLLILVISIGMTTIYAEETTVDIPFDVKSVTCVHEEGTLIATCTFLGTEGFALPDGITPPLTEEKEIIDEESDVTEPTNEPELTREQKEIQRMIDRIELDLQERPDAVPNVDKQLLILLKRAQDLCEFGTEESAPIQSYSKHAIPKGFLYSDDTDFSKNKMYGDIYKLVEACEGNADYKVKWLGPQYANIQKANDDAIIWTPTATLSTNVTNTAEYMNRFISEHDKIEANEDAEIYKCSVDGKRRGFCPQAIGPIDYVHDTTDNLAMKKFNAYKADPENAVGEPRYSVTTDPKCYTVASFIAQHEISKENGDIMLKAAGCTVN